MQAPQQETMHQPEGDQFQTRSSDRIRSYYRDKKYLKKYIILALLRKTKY